MMDIETLKKLRKSLPVGYARILQERMNGRFSRAMIVRVVIGERNNEDILDEAILLAEECKQKLLDRKAKINKIYSK